MVPAVTLRRSKTIAIIALAAATLLAAVWLAPRGPRRAVTIAPPPAGDPCEMGIGSRLSSSHVMVGSHEEHLVVTLRAPSCGQARARAPMSVAIVLDRSGSMAPPSVPVADQPLTHAKEAALALVDQLGPADAFSVVVYALGAEVVLPMTAATTDGKAAARRAIAGIEAEPSTNIQAGLEAGLRELATSPVLDGLRRIVLISDGDANEGVRTVDGLTRIAAGIANQGVSISSVGLGLSYNEAIMTSVAAAGRGNYNFVEDSSQLAAIFTAELRAAGQTVATDAELALAAAPGVDILEVFGYGAHLEGATWVIPVADLTAGEQRKIVARVRVTATPGTAMELATATLWYRPIAAHQRRQVASAASAEITGDAQVVRAGIDPSTVKLVEEAETARAIDEATAAYAREGYAGAERVLAARKASAQATASEYRDADIAASSVRAVEAVQRGFAAAPAASGDGGARAAKGAGKAAYDLAR